jgi:competence protein ComEC
LDKNQLQGIYQLAMQTRNWCLGVLNKYVESGDKIAVVSALILGYRNLINQDVYAAFSDTGAVHILAVSGMHLTLISGALFFILKLLKIQNKYIRIVLQLSCIWFFTLITGIGAAILRAAVMLTFLIMAKETRQTYNIYNVIGLVCFLIILYEPGQLFQAGFQFSICAVLSLMFFQEIIEGQWQPENRLASITWNLVSTSISATILVIPLTIYFFHKFPLYFVLSGLIPVVSSTFAMYVGLAMMILEAIYLGFINKWLAYVINFLLDVFLESIKWIKNLPFCSIDGLTLSGLEFGLLMLSLFIVMFYISTRSKILVYYLGTFIIIILSSIIWRVHLANHQTKVIVYDVNKNGSIDFIDGRTVYNYTGTPLDKLEEGFIYQNNRYFHFAQDIVQLQSDDILYGERIRIDENSIRFKDKKMIILDKPTPNVNLGTNDYIYLTNDIEFDPKINMTSNNLCIIDKTFNYENYRNWIEYLEEKRIPYHDVKSKGSLTINL